MFGKGLKAQYATCFTVCLLCFAFGLIVKPNLKQNPMLHYSMGFLILHFRLNLTEATFDFETTKDNKLVWTTPFTTDCQEWVLLPSFHSADEYNYKFNGSYPYVIFKQFLLEQAEHCLDTVEKISNCSETKFSFNEDVRALFFAHPNMERYVSIGNGIDWEISSKVPYSKLGVIQREFRQMVELEFKLQRTKVMLMICVYNSSLPPDADQLDLPLEKKIRDLSLKLLPTSEELLTNVAYSDFLMPYYMGQISGAFLLGFLINIIGRKKILITISLTLVLSKLFLMIPEKFSLMYVQKQFTGFGLAGFYIIVPTYICEIAEDKVRGRLFSFLNLFLLLGRLRLFFVDGLNVYRYLNSGLSYMDYFDTVSIVLAIILLVASPWLTESPPYLLLKNKTDEAKKSLVKLGRNADDFEMENSTDSNISNGTNGWLKNVTPNFVTVKGLIICCALIIIQFLSFNNFKENFSRGILKNYNHLLNAYNIFWIEISLQLTALIFVIVLIDRAGRRFLLLASCMGMAFCSFILIFMYFAVSFSNDNFELLNWIYWIPVVSWAGFHFCFYLGMGSIPRILVAEILNTKARGPAMAFIVLMSVAFSITFHFTSILTEHDYLPAIQGVNGALGALFVYFYVPETKQMALEVISKELKK